MRVSIKEDKLELLVFIYSVLLLDNATSRQHILDPSFLNMQVVGPSARDQ